MAAPKVVGCFFGGDLQGEPKPAGRLPGSSPDWLEIDWPEDEAESRLPLGAACISLAVSERTCRTQEIYRSASREQFRSDATDLRGIRPGTEKINTA